MIDNLSSPEIVLPVLLLALFCVLRSLTSWVAGFQLLIVAIVFGGMIGARAGATALPIAFRDAFIVLPLYVAFAASKAGREALARLPAGVTLGVGAILFWIVASLFNPKSVSGLQLLIGLKVWLFYIPFLLVGVVLAGRPNALFKTFRVLLVCGSAACAIGLLQAALIRLMGYQAAIALFFGSAAADVTQRFAMFSEGGGIYRIPGTFSFAGQYVEFLFLFLVATAIEANADPDPRWQRIGLVAFYLGMLAGLFSGTKAAFLAFPALAGVFFAFRLIKRRLAIGAPIAVGVAGWAIGAARLDPTVLLSFGVRQAEDYGQGFILQQIEAAVHYGSFGQGVGSSTGAARFAAIGSDLGSRLGFESYYAKIAAELGTIGLTIFGVFLISVAVRAALIALRHWQKPGNALIAPLAIYILFNLAYSFKGFVIDTDPGNVFFWLVLGLMLRLDRDLRASHGQPSELTLDLPRIPVALDPGSPSSPL